MNNVQVTPTAMERIINIQMMHEVIFPTDYNRDKDFEFLSQQSEDELWYFQENLIPVYNEAVKTKEKINKLKDAFKAPSFPVNPIPFAQGIADGVRANGSAWIASDDAKKILYILISQAYGQTFHIDGVDEWNRLNKV